MVKVFIDGKAGTTGLRIYERLGKRDDVQIVSLSENLRKDVAARKDAINNADVVFLCLPDDAAREAVTLVENPAVKIIDASTAHRTQEGWAYGFPELSDEFRHAVAFGNRIANPGCHASGFISLVYPLVRWGLVAPDYPFVCHSVTGYTGGGNKMIAQYESAERDVLLDSPRQYGLTQAHKHLPEMQKICSLARTPVFCPIVSDFDCGMCVTVPLFADLLARRMTVRELAEFFADYYAGQKFISVTQDSEGGFLSANALRDTNRMELFVGGNDERILLCSRFDNLGKGASGAAIQNMNIALGLDESISL